MPRRARRAPRRRVMRMRKRKSKVGGVLSVPRSMKSAPQQFAKVIETIQVNDGLSGNPYGRQFALSQFPRACNIATNYKWYKATKVTWTYQPLFNTFQENLTGPSVGKPQIYFSMNRSQDTVYQTLSDFQAEGSQPQTLVKNKVITYKPNWCSPGLLTWVKDGATGLVQFVRQSGLTVNYGWLASTPYNNYATNKITTPFADQYNQTPGSAPPVGLPNIPVDVSPVNTLYNGHADYTFQENNPTIQNLYALTCTVEWSFKQPFFFNQNTIEPTKAEPPVV